MCRKARKGSKRGTGRKSAWWLALVARLSPKGGRRSDRTEARQTPPRDARPPAWTGEKRESERGREQQKRTREWGVWKRVNPLLGRKMPIVGREKGVPTEGIEKREPSEGKRKK